MPRRDLYHDAVVHALEKAGWTITADPFKLGYGTRNLYVDLGADPRYAYDEVFSDQFGQMVIRQHQLRLIVFEEDQQEIIRWLP